GVFDNFPQTCHRRELVPIQCDEFARDIDSINWVHTSPRRWTGLYGKSLASFLGKSTAIRGSAPNADIERCQSPTVLLKQVRGGSYVTRNFPTKLPSSVPSGFAISQSLSSASGSE